MFPFLRALALPAALLFALPAAANEGIHITDPYTRIVQGNGVIYFRIENHTEQADRLISAESQAHMTSLMTTSEDANGMMQMRDLPDGFEIEAGGTRILRPAGDHVMLMHLAPEPAPGELLTVVLTFEHAGKITLAVPIDNGRRTEPGPGPTPHDMSSGD